MRIKDNKGFTLVELLVVIAIIGILSVVAVPSLFKQIDKAKIAEVKNDVSVIQTATKMFYLDNGRWPCTRHKQNENEEVFDNIDSSSRKSPFSGDYAVYCIHKSVGQVEDKTQPIVRIDIGGFTVSDSVRGIMEDDEFFKNMNTTISGDNNTVWMKMQVSE